MTSGTTTATRIRFFLTPLPILVIGAIICQPVRAGTSAYWTNPAGGSWTAGSNWSTAPLYPDNDQTATYDAIIDLAGDPYTIGLDSDITIDNFTLNSPSATVVHGASGVLSVVGTANIQSGTYRINDYGTIAGGTWNAAPGTMDINRAVFSDVTFNGDLELDNESDNLWIYNDFNLNGTITLSGYNSRLRFWGSQTFDHATVNLSGMGSRLTFTQDDGAPPAILGPELMVYAADGTVYARNLTNRGLIQVPTGGQLTFSTRNFVNEGRIEANGGDLEINAAGWPFLNAPGGEVLVTDGWLRISETYGT